MPITTIAFDTKIDGKKQAAFTILHTSHPLYASYPGLPKEQQEMHIPVCLMLRRWDGQTGFPGGFVEEEETLLDAALRELDEEVGFVVQDRTRLQPVVAHDIGKITTHAFAMHVPWSELVQVAQNIFSAEHFGSETCGPSLEHLIDYDVMGKKGKGFMNVLRMPLAPSVREEVAHFMLQSGYMTYDQLGVVCARAGYSVVDLAQGYVAPVTTTMNACAFDGDRPIPKE